MITAHVTRWLVTSLLLVSTFPAQVADEHPLGADSKPQPGVPKGEVLQFSFDRSRIFPGTYRDYWVYVPAQYTPDRPACLYVNQDGIQYEAPIVFDNLIHKREMPITIGVFVMHGRVRAADPSKALDRFNRSYEYDGLGDNYVRFLLEELLPDVETKKTSDGRAIHLPKSGNDRAIGGQSSGAICAFTAAWERPDAFSRVFSAIGTYVGLRGGDRYATLIRKFEPKPIRIFMQDGSNDLNIYAGDWWIANQLMERALVFSGYEVKHVWGEGGHNGRHATAMFPGAMRWLWKDWPQPVKAGVDSKQPIMQVLTPGEGWQLVSSGHRFTEGPAVNEKGEVFFTDVPSSRIHKVDVNGNVTLFAENTGGANGLMFGPDGRLYACANGKKQIVAYDSEGNPSVVVDGIESNDLAIAANGNIYITDPRNKKVWLARPDGTKVEVDGIINRPNGVALSPDQTLLYVADTAGQYVYSFQIQADGALAHKQPFFHLHVPEGAMESGADGLTVDAEGRLYVATAMGLQVCDQVGRVNGIIAKPQRAWLANVVFGGPDLGDLFVTCGDKVFRRRVKAKGVLSFKPPIKPAPPRL